MAGCKSYYLVVFCHSFEETYCVGSDCDVGLGCRSVLDLDWQGYVVGLGGILLAVQNCLVDVNKKSFFADIALVSDEVDLPLFQISESGGFYLVVVPEDLEGDIEVVKSPLVLALQSSAHMGEVVALDFVELRGLKSMVLRYSDFAETADGGGLLGFGGSFGVDALFFLHLLV